MDLVAALLCLSRPVALPRARHDAGETLLARLEALARGRVSGGGGRAGFVISEDSRDEVVARVAAHVVRLATLSPAALFRPIAERPELAPLLDSTDGSFVGVDPSAVEIADRLLTRSLRTMLARAAFDLGREDAHRRLRRSGFAPVSVDEPEIPEVPAREPPVDPDEARFARAELRRAIRHSPGAVEGDKVATLQDLMDLQAGETTTEALVCRRLERRDRSFAETVERRAQRVRDAARRWRPPCTRSARAATILDRAVERRDAELVEDVVRNLEAYGGEATEEIRREAIALRDVIRTAAKSREGIAARNAIHQAQSRLRRELKGALVGGGKPCCGRRLLYAPTLPAWTRTFRRTHQRFVVLPFEQQIASDVARALPRRTPILHRPCASTHSCRESARVPGG